MTDVLTSVNGFVPARTLDGSGCLATQRFRKDATATGDDARIAIGDPVVLTANGTVKKMLATTDDAGTFIGVVAGVTDSTGKPKEHRAAQASSVSLSAETTDMFDVIVGTDVVYRVATQLSAQTFVSAQKYIGENAGVAYLAADANDTKLGRSTGYVVATTSADTAFRIAGVPEIVGSGNQYVEVIPNKVVFTNNTSSV